MSLKVIALKNISNRGKTSTIKIVAEILYHKYLNQEKKFNSEVSDIIDININDKNICIAIISQGDPGTGLIKKLNEKTAKQCDIIICATRTSGETVEAVKEIVDKNNGLLIWTTTYDVNDNNLQVKMNTLKAKQIIELIEDIS
ncbi:hypothetical protein [Aliarcobacter skirrowii]|uniref:hypothetical protein n=1 Tax=Aliarcobacter skirrowii TaxID=28200 RepID=UPI0021B27CFD|nr:hypothetical protein [Aliarcobacter skirrowii]MCT7447013.1 hypothetical protein [Aliarcobacter skirrowii]